MGPARRDLVADEGLADQDDRVEHGRHGEIHRAMDEVDRHRRRRADGNGLAVDQMMPVVGQRDQPHRHGQAQQRPIEGARRGPVLAVNVIPDEQHPGAGRRENAQPGHLGPEHLGLDPRHDVFDGDGDIPPHHRRQHQDQAAPAGKRGQAQGQNGERHLRRASEGHGQREPICRKTHPSPPHLRAADIAGADGARSSISDLYIVAQRHTPRCDDGCPFGEIGYTGFYISHVLKIIFKVDHL